MQAKRESVQLRNADTRMKIMLGGLFVKAGLESFYPHDPATLYGMLLYNKQLMTTNPEMLDKWKELGKELMINKEQSK